MHIYLNNFNFHICFCKTHNNYCILFVNVKDASSSYTIGQTKLKCPTVVFSNIQTLFIRFTQLNLVKYLICRRSFPHLYIELIGLWTLKKVGYSRNGDCFFKSFFLCICTSSPEAYWHTFIVKREIDLYVLVTFLLIYKLGLLRCILQLS